jgi:hypothetical protein
MTRFLGIGQAP